MATEGQILNYLLAWDLSFRVGGTPDEILDAAKAALKSKESKEDVDNSDEAEVNEIYLAYPSKDKNHNNRSLQKKPRQDKEQIRKLLKYANKETILYAIKKYVDDCDANKIYKKNFSTFLNGISFDELENIEVVSSSGENNWQ